ncbi:unnamed protein product [Strongylus vulgaris]|uniref:Uncharacterized protein n=1 Tax=Strongylus vulgaris TaxID=40348 RepID=A0A3P7M2C3_STRVU|nr:unnamed protein product [Strongylus vulgaris]
MVRHQGARNAVSNIAFVRTRFAVPDPPRLTKAEALGTDEILHIRTAYTLREPQTGQSSVRVAHAPDVAEAQ